MERWSSQALGLSLVGFFPRLEAEGGGTNDAALQLFSIAANQRLWGCHRSRESSLCFLSFYGVLNPSTV
jgi:hypothetical protein